MCLNSRQVYKKLGYLRFALPWNKGKSWYWCGHLCGELTGNCIQKSKSTQNRELWSKNVANENKRIRQIQSYKYYIDVRKFSTQGNGMPPTVCMPSEFACFTSIAEILRPSYWLRIVTLVMKSIAYRLSHLGDILSIDSANQSTDSFWSMFLFVILSIISTGTIIITSTRRIFRTWIFRNCVSLDGDVMMMTHDVEQELRSSVILQK